MRTSVRVVKELSPSRKGAIAEAAIALAALKAGLIVYRPVAEGGRADLILGLADGRLLKTQCKWARRKGDVIAINTRTCRHTPNGYVRTTYSANEIDAVAAYCPEVERVYLIPIAEVEGVGYIHLRLAPARNNQRAGTRMAAQFDLGAIAQLGERLSGTQEVAGSSPASSI